MDGQRRAFYHDHNFQCIAGSTELNCCSTNAARGLGMLSQWAAMNAPDGLALNYYGPAAVTAATPSGGSVTLIQKTAYPLDGRVAVTVGMVEAERFVLRLRIPQWSAHAQASVNDELVAKATAGTYLTLDRRWGEGSRTDLDLDLPFHFWVGEEGCAGLTSLYRGPILLAYNQRYNRMDQDDVPTLNAASLASGAK